LAHPESANCSVLLDGFGGKKCKEAFNVLCKKLLDLLTEEKLQLNLNQKACHSSSSPRAPLCSHALR
jgi:hypothetical protein